jgi:alkane 1-monooxygenase
MGRLNLLWVMYMHFTTEHNHGHHRNYATELDPASSPKGRGLWTQIIKTIPLQFIAAWKTHSDKGRKGIKNPILHGLTIQITFVGGLYYGLGLNVVLAFLLSATVAIILLEFVNYLQHYGLRAEVGEKQTVAHSWESRNLWSRWTLLELPLHPAHHLKASDPMWNLRAQEGAPQLPFGYYVCFWLALIPPLWKNVMNKRVP